MKKMRLFPVSLFLLILVLGASGQIQNGQFAGTVTDPSGAAIAKATVTITNHGTNLSVIATTNQSGDYTAKELPVGTYTVKVEAAGFRTSENAGAALNAGSTARLDFKLTLGQAREVVEVTAEASAINVEDSKLASTVNSTQISNLPLNGRNVYDLMQMAPGAVNVQGVDFEQGHGTVVNGLREDFNGFLINGVSNKQLSGGVINVPIQDTVQEFQELQLNMSAQYGNSAGAINNLVTKSGTNQFHGSAWEYVRNDVFDANEFFLNQVPDPRKDPNGTLCAAGNTADCFHPALRFNQFGFTVGGPIVKDKLFFFVSAQGDRFKTSSTPQTVIVESPEWRQAVATAFPNSVANLLYGNFAPTLPGTGGVTLNQYAPAAPAGFPAGTPDFDQWLCARDTLPAGVAAKMATMIGVTAMDQAVMRADGCTNIPGIQNGAMSRSAPFEQNGISILGSQTQSIGNLFNGNEWSARLDYNWNSSNRLFAQFNYLRETDSFGPCPTTSCARGFSNPSRNIFPNGQFSYIHTFSPTILNEFRAGYAQTNGPAITTTTSGVPQINFDDGTAGFGSYSGYPQTFVENIYTYSDMVSISHGNHNLKFGGDLRRNLENSQFNVARSSFEMFDPIYFAADAPAEQVGGADPGICGPPCPASSFNPNPQSQLASNIRHWRNWEVGLYFQDDWKVTRRLTLNLGLRYDLFTRHTEEDNLATTFILGPGSNILAGVIDANALAGNPGCTTPMQQALSQLAGVCGPGGFAPASSLGKGDHNDFGPRVGFAWDVFGNGKTAMRGGFGVSYEGTLYNPLSNSRWNLPYYSFNIADNALNSGGQYVMYGPTVCSTPGHCQPDPTQLPRFTGPATNPGQGTGAQAVGNLTGWDSANPNLGYLTGIVFPQGIRDPYVYNYFLGVQHEIMNGTSVEVNYVGTAGHKLFRSEDVNRSPGSELPVGVCLQDNLGRTNCGFDGRPNNNYGKLRVWENVVNSNYNALQMSVRRKMSHGILFNVNYTYSHTIDGGSTWHSGATTANGAGAGEGFTYDATLPQLDRGNSLFDIRQRLVLNYVIQLPGQNMKGVMGAILGGWSYNGIWAFQSGAHWEPYISTSSNLVEASNNNNSCTTADYATGNCVNIGGDYNLDAGKNDRPNSSLPGFGSFDHTTWAKGWANGQAGLPVLSAPCLGCTGDLGRNTFVGPGTWYADMTLSKNFKITERFNLRFEGQGFNVFNHTNFILATAGGNAHNDITDGLFGQAAGTLNARNVQLGLKLSF